MINAINVFYLTDEERFYGCGWNDALDAAHKAVAKAVAMSETLPYGIGPELYAAIDALRQEKK